MGMGKRPIRDAMRGSQRDLFVVGPGKLRPREGEGGIPAGCGPITLPWFVGSDAAKALGYDQPHKAVERHCRYGTKRTVPHPQSPDKMIEMSFIPESGLYALILASNAPVLQRKKPRRLHGRRFGGVWRSGGFGILLKEKGKGCNSLSQDSDAAVVPVEDIAFVHRVPGN